MNIQLELKDPAWGVQAVASIKQIAADCREELDACDKAGTFPRETFREMGRRGLVGVVTSTEYGGYGGGVPEYCLTTEAMARYGLVSSQAQIQGQRWINEWGTPAQKQKYLPGMVQGTLLFSESISEPGAASSLKSLKTTAVRRGGDWIIEGRKTHINMGVESHVTIVYAMAEEGLTSFLVDTNLPGVSGRHTEPIGYRFLPTADMFFDKVRIPADAVLGSPGQGLKTFLSTFNVSRLGNASELIGFARKALSDAIVYARERRVGEGVVTDFQGIQWTIADSYSGLYGASMVRDHAANLAERGAEHAMETSMAKKLAIEAAEKTINEVFALVGGHGLYRDKSYGQLLFDIKTLRVAGGSLEILRNFVAQCILKDKQLRGLM